MDYTDYTFIDRLILLSFICEGNTKEKNSIYFEFDFANDSFLLDIYQMGNYSGYLFVCSDQWDFPGCSVS